MNMYVLVTWMYITRIVIIVIGLNHATEMGNGEITIN